MPCRQVRHGDAISDNRDNSWRSRGNKVGKGWVRGVSLGYN